MNEETFNIVFPIGILIIYFSIKLLVDNKNNRTPWYEEVFSYPLDILFLGIAFIGGILTKNLSVSLLGIIVLISYIVFCFISKGIINLTMNLFYTNRKWWGYFCCLLNYICSMLLIYFTLSIIKV
jgi:hypothetical protein